MSGFGNKFFDQSLADAKSTKDPGSGDFTKRRVPSTRMVIAEEARMLTVQDGHKKFMIFDAFEEGLPGVKAEFGSALVGGSLDGIDICGCGEANLYLLFPSMPCFRLRMCAVATGRNDPGTRIIPRANNPFDAHNRSPQHVSSRANPDFRS